MFGMGKDKVTVLVVTKHKQFLKPRKAKADSQGIVDFKHKGQRSPFTIRSESAGNAWGKNTMVVWREGEAEAYPIFSNNGKPAMCPKCNIIVPVDHLNYLAPDGKSVLLTVPVMGESSHLTDRTIDELAYNTYARDAMEFQQGRRGAGETLKQWAPIIVGLVLILAVGWVGLQIGDIKELIQFTHPVAPLPYVTPTPTPAAFGTAG